MRFPAPCAVRRKATSLRKNVSQRTLVLSIRQAMRFEGVRKTRCVAASAGAVGGGGGGCAGGGGGKPRCVAASAGAVASAVARRVRASRFMRRRAYLESGAHG